MVGSELNVSPEVQCSLNGLTKLMCSTVTSLG